ncbi:hypothetical protein [Streptococcus sp. E17BB]|uniref:DUF6895 family protein n=1 Tax=Streptococcus sp. E17BB TaxID=3278714 RepID=UPI00359D5906
MKNWKDDILAIVSNSLTWIEDSLDKFSKSKKSRAEFCQMCLFQKKISIDDHLQKLLTFYDPLDSQGREPLYYRRLEYYALLKLQGDDTVDSTIQFLFKNGLFYKLSFESVPFDILASREHLYAITHDIFYTSIFGKETAIFDILKPKEPQLLAVLEYAILLSIRHDDTDVFMELIACIFILDVADKLSVSCQELCYFYMKNTQLKNGSFKTQSNSTAKESFEEVYHTTLVAGIIFFVLGGCYEFKSV